MVPKSVTLNGPERRNGPFCVISQNSVASGVHCIKVVEGVVVNKLMFAMSSPDAFLVTKTHCGTSAKVEMSESFLGGVSVPKNFLRSQNSR